MRRLLIRSGGGCDTVNLDDLSSDWVFVYYSDAQVEYNIIVRLFVRYPSAGRSFIVRIKYIKCTCIIYIFCTYIYTYITRVPETTRARARSIFIYIGTRISCRWPGTRCKGISEQTLFTRVRFILLFI